MKVDFANQRLLECYTTSARAIRTWGPTVARKYIQRVNTLYAIQQFNDLYKIRSLRLHKLSGQMAGQFSIHLDSRWRLMLTYLEEENKVLVEEVTNHYGD
ncbi:MAG: type II toxin-antitoxin system RelE/ParE family toxin [Chloroflexi bacterium]|nr:type II toxin-antitoxin system RelE/ParE family toxin [Chloroflexota bacterium]